MSAHWWWTWSIGLPATAYANSSWALDSTTTVITNSTDTLNSPDPSAQAPGEEFCLELQDAGLNSPAFSNGTVSAGWFITRWNGSGSGLFSNAVRIVELISGSTVRILLRPSTSGGSTTTLSLLVNGTLIGTSSTSFGDAAAVIAIDFDLTQNPPQAGLVVNGVREISRAGGSGSPTTVDRIGLGPGKSTAGATSYFGDLAIFSALSDFSDVAVTQDVWVTFLDPDSVTDGDNSWTPSSGTDLTAINDGSTTTYTQTTTDPDSLTIGFESTTDRLSTWAPTVIYGVAAITYGTASVITSTTLTMDDANGEVESVTETLNAIGNYVGTWEPLDSTGAAWSAFAVNSITIDYEVSS